MSAEVAELEYKRALKQQELVLKEERETQELISSAAEATASLGLSQASVASIVGILSNDPNVLEQKDRSRLMRLHVAACLKALEAFEKV